MFFFDPPAGAFSFVSAVCKPGDAEWILCDCSGTVLKLNDETLILTQQGPVNRLDIREGDGLWVVSEDITQPVRFNFAPEWTIPGENTYFLMSSDGDQRKSKTVTYHEISNKSHPAADLISIVGGATLYFAAYCAAHRCNGWLELAFYDKEGSAIDREPFTRTAIEADKYGGSDIKNYTLCKVSARVPVDAEYVQPRIIKSATTTGEDSFLFFVRPYLSYCIPPNELPIETLTRSSTESAELFSRHATNIFEYRCMPSLSIFSGHPVNIYLIELRNNKYVVLGSTTATLPRITGVEIDLISRRVMTGKIFIESKICEWIPLYICGADAAPIAPGRAHWDGKSYRFAFILPHYPFDVGTHALSLFDVTLKVKLLDVIYND